MLSCSGLTLLAQARPAAGSFSDAPFGHYLLDPNGKPFFWLGDTAWLLFQIPTREDAELYLQTRALQGFTLIQAAVVMGEERVGGTLRPNVYGEPAFVDEDPARPNPAYWANVDYVVSRAEAHRLVLGLLPLFVGSQGDGFKYLNVCNAYAYGKFLGERYGRKPNVIWILGGDNIPGSGAKRQVWALMAERNRRGGDRRRGLYQNFSHLS